MAASASKATSLRERRLSPLTFAALILAGCSGATDPGDRPRVETTTLAGDELPPGFADSAIVEVRPDRRLVIRGRAWGSCTSVDVEMGWTGRYHTGLLAVVTFEPEACMIQSSPEERWFRAVTWPVASGTHHIMIIEESGFGDDLFEALYSTELHVP
jgi:hypothetical protein